MNQQPAQQPQSPGKVNDFRGTSSTGSLASAPSNNSHISSFKFPKFPGLKAPIIFVVLAVIAVTLGIFFAFNKSFFEKPQPSPTPQKDYSKPPAENLLADNGRIVAINEQEKIFEIASTNTNWEQKWRVKIGDKTTLADSEDWSNPKGILQERLLTITAEELAQIVPKLNYSDYKIGDIVYLIAANGQDLAKDLGVFEPFAILLFRNAR